MKKKKLVLIGGHPKGYEEPFHIKTKSGRILRKITDELRLNPLFFDLWDNQAEEDSRTLKGDTKKKLEEFTENKFVIIALGRYIEKVIIDSGYKCIYLPHPASRDAKYLKKLKCGLEKFK
jgi:hypothetical protein